MGFGFNLFFVLILVPLTGVLLVSWLVFQKPIIGKALGVIWSGVIGLVVLSLSLQWIVSKTKLDKDDYYGNYIVKRDFFRGEQADWQYNHFRFEIKEDDSIIFYETEG